MSALGDPPPTADSFHFDENLRYLMVAFMAASAYLLFFSDAVWPAFVSQIAWMVLESNLYEDTGLSNLRNFMIQFFILCVITASMCSTSIYSASEDDEDHHVPAPHVPILDNMGAKMKEN